MNTLMASSLKTVKTFLKNGLILYSIYYIIIRYDYKTLGALNLT